MQNKYFEGGYSKNVGAYCYVEGSVFGLAFFFEMINQDS